MEKGYVQVYTGNGKGKTTCALGLSLRAVCSDKKVFFGQFLKGMDYSELKAPNILPNFTLKQYGTDRFIGKNPSKEDYEMAREALEDAKKNLLSNNYDIIVLDEISVACYMGLISVDDIINLIRIKPDNVELVLTGRYADEKIIEIADLVTNMDEIKHYYKKGVQARVGIEK
ncbi:MAG: cob(I)yrinic acid a,c-diamide adenosyltransferase [Peptoanaerobacter stomatis]|uniref:cob(I)yrinic acid a,c-diamide adenosyltransferase n=1 Tax=Peptoanaerobacter stomatis TaxID=796937 RepID=UPI003F9F98CC